jgi:KDO2-lipid IV(A) lauroyltransferase
MKYIGFILAYSFIWLLHLLPEKILFLFSDLLYLLTYYLVGYRKKVVYDNLRKAFPDLEQSEIRKIAKKYYHHLCDLILESALSHFLSEEEYITRISFLNLELLHVLYGKGKQVICVTAHYGNWEFLTTLGVVTDFRILGAYKPLKNRYFDRLIRQNRERFKSLPVPMEKIAREMIHHHQEKIPALTVFLADQRPMFQNIQYWTKFMGQDTPVYLGPEKLAKKLDAAVVFAKIRKKSRGRYEAEFELICEEPGELEPYGITESHVRILEKLIREAPSYWLWSHRRWKHSLERYNERRQQKSAAV